MVSLYQETAVVLEPTVLPILHGEMWYTLLTAENHTPLGLVVLVLERLTHTA
jgi:hypothetical protein